MGLVSSTLMAALRLSWICQKLLDPRYSCIEGGGETVPVRKPLDGPAASATSTAPVTSEQQAAATDSAAVSEQGLAVASKMNSALATGNKSPENNNSLHQENRNRRAAQLRFKTRPSSFDAALIVRGRSKNSLLLAPTQPCSPLRRRRNAAPADWDDASSSSGCSSDPGSASDSDSETELRVSENVSNEEGSKPIGMSAEEEEAFRLTVGRGHFSRSKKDRFLNHLRLEKRLNDLNNDYFGLACKGHHHHHHHHRHRHLQRRHSGDLHRIV
ncbi:uncharacterized protein DDB_G0281497 [Nasonia vitripennis]|uniref:Uncharacterized protein n=1 Tax=Nasonia vitripennis TaxID=7425 RepID=A0A7M7GDH2_NASVI|nr:uncharacterized protein DDB_G0281497 [Nasonia vitripennis]